ncbi:MAG: S-adenosylmethionine decarboxylase proenzyme [Planctomycetota bacterium]|jgi:S-adenosylmethionine decarboxylase proenzyme
MNKKIGTHVIADIDLEDSEILVDRPFMTAILLNALEAESFEIIAVSGHDFPGGGFTTVVLLAESHASIHTYPEMSYLAFDLFSCGSKDPSRVLAHILSEMNPRDVRKTIFTRQTKD